MIPLGYGKIYYCTKLTFPKPRFVFVFLVRHLRAGWMAQELLLTFGNTIGELALIPGKSATFIVRVNGGI